MGAFTVIPSPLQHLYIALYNYSIITPIVEAEPHFILSFLCLMNHISRNCYLASKT